MTAEPNLSSSRFSTLTDEQLLQLRDGRLSESTKKMIANAVKTLDEYTRSNGSSMVDVETMPAEQLDKLLSRFYAECRKCNGNLYARKSLQSLRFWLQQHFKKTSGIDIVSDPQFKSSAEMFAAVLVNLKKAGVGAVVHKDALTTEDFSKLYSSHVLNTSNPVGLQNKVFIDLMIHLCNRGRENLREMTTADFQIMSDSAGNRYVCIKDKQTKNHRGDGNAENSQNGRIYETPGLPRCPVTSFEKYISKLNGDYLAFWQKPKSKFNENDVCWYQNMAVGKNTLYDKMKSISTAAGLSQKYTNHCLRATCITALDQSGFEARHIMSVSGQKCESSIRAYSHNVAENVRRNMSLSLSTHTAVIPAAAGSSGQQSLSNATEQQHL